MKLPFYIFSVLNKTNKVKNMTDWNTYETISVMQLTILFLCINEYAENIFLRKILFVREIFLI